MRIEFMIAERGFRLETFEHSFDEDCLYLFRFGFFWKNIVKSASLKRYKEDSAAFRFMTNSNGKVSGWEFQGPIRRIG